MKTLNKLTILVLVFSSLTVFAAADAKKDNSSSKSIESEFDGLGGNGALLDKARALNPEVHATVVQNRMVDRTNRFEVSGEYANTFGGDTYIRTGTFGLSAQYHITNKWSLGAKYGMSYNKLTNEGNDLVERATQDHIKNPQTSESPVPDIDYPKSMVMGYVNFYPLYGKISWLGKSITHFDVYGQLGYGTMELKSGNAPIMSGGLGVGVWGNQNITTRFEMRYMDYTAKYYNGDMKQGITSAAIQIGWLL